MNAPTEHQRRVGLKGKKKQINQERNERNAESMRDVPQCSTIYRSKKKSEAQKKKEKRRNSNVDNGTMRGPRLYRIVYRVFFFLPNPWEIPKRFSWQTQQSMKRNSVKLGTSWERCDAFHNIESNASWRVGGRSTIRFCFFVWLFFVIDAVRPSIGRRSRLPSRRFPRLPTPSPENTHTHPEKGFVSQVSNVRGKTGRYFFFVYGLTIYSVFVYWFLYSNWKSESQW